MESIEKMAVGVVIERRDSDNRWIDYLWQPVAVIPGAPPLEEDGEWRLLQEGEGWCQFHIGTLELELHRGETEGYRANLRSSPQIYVVLARGEEADEPEVVPFLVTACPYEGESYTESGEEIVEGVPMPLEVQGWIEDFIEKHHVDQPFKKQKVRKAYDPRKGGFARNPSVRGNGEGRG